MLNHAKIATKSRLLQNFTGLNVQAFVKLLPSFEKIYEQALANKDTARTIPRERQRSGGRKPILETAADKLLFILFYH